MDRLAWIYTGGKGLSLSVLVLKGLIYYSDAKTP
jgi:hypothetical protein